MNLPNKLTVFRLCMVPIFLICLCVPLPIGDTALRIITAAIFAVVSLTDMIDGKIARKYNLITDFGKFMDPLADKCLVVAAMVWFVEVGRMPGWALLVVLVREFAVSGIRMQAANLGRVIAAGWSGKVKTASTMVCICAMLLLPGIAVLDLLCVAVIVLTTVYSGMEYLIKNKDVMSNMK